MKRTLSTFVAIVATSFFVAGCSASANLTAPPSSIEEQAAAALQDQVGAPEPPAMDCGDEDIDLVEGTVVDCVLTDPDSGTEYDSTVTLSDVDGTDFHISVEVAQEPRS